MSHSYQLPTPADTFHMLGNLCQWLVVMNTNHLAYSRKKTTCFFLARIIFLCCICIHFASLFLFLEDENANVPGGRLQYRSYTPTSVLSYIKTWAISWCRFLLFQIRSSSVDSDRKTLPSPSQWEFPSFSSLSRTHVSSAIVWSIISPLPHCLLKAALLHLYSASLF